MNHSIQEAIMFGVLTVDTPFSLTPAECLHTCSMY
jgi:hypothetical protein